MIVITANGRLAQQPELRALPGGSSVVEFRLLSNRYAKGQEVVEAVTFFCYGDQAERFCENAEKGQVVIATGTQETQTYKDGQGQQRSYVKYRLSNFELGSRPYRGDRQGGQAPAPANQNYGTQQRRYGDAPARGQFQSQRPSGANQNRSYQEPASDAYQEGVHDGYGSGYDDSNTGLM